MRAISTASQHVTADRRSDMRRWVLAVLLCCAFTFACSSSSKGSNTSQPTCAETRAHVQSLYQAEIARPAKGDDSAETVARQRVEVADNVEMMLTDCQVAPSRFIPCLKAAASVAQMERDCLIPLDDEGTVEGRAFRGDPARRAFRGDPAK